MRGVYEALNLRGGGRVKISDFAVGKGEQVKFKFFAMLINFCITCFRGENSDITERTMKLKMPAVLFVYGKFLTVDFTFIFLDTA